MNNKKTYTIRDIVSEMLKFQMTQEYKYTYAPLSSFITYLENKEKGKEVNLK